MHLCIFVYGQVYSTGIWNCLLHCIVFFSIVLVYTTQCWMFCIVCVLQFCVSASDSRRGQLDRVGNDTDGRTGGMQVGTHYIPLWEHKPWTYDQVTGMQQPHSRCELRGLWCFRELDIGRGSVLCYYYYKTESKMLQAHGLQQGKQPSKKGKVKFGGSSLLPYTVNSHYNGLQYNGFRM